MVAESLRTNMQRLSGFSRLPVAIFNYARRYHHLFVQTALREIGDINESTDPAKQERLHDAFDRALEDWIIGGHPVAARFPGVLMIRDVAGVAAFPELLPDNAIEAFCGSVVIQSWTAFENLAEDLWVAAINSHPSKLANLAGNPRGKYRQQNRAAPSEKYQQPGKTVPLSELEFHGYDLRKRMGDVLRNSRKVVFRSLADIREAYHRAFSEQAADVDNVLDDPGLQYASAVRNVLIHKAGRVDDEYREQTAGLTGIARVAVGEKLPLTGEVAEKLADDTIDCAFRLFRAVHAWIIGHL